MRKWLLMIGLCCAILVAGAPVVVNMAIEMVDMNATPAPEAIWLLGSGLIGLFGFRRRIQR